MYAFMIPGVAQDLAARREDYRIMRENVMLVVRDYNMIIEELDPSERRLFKGSIDLLNKRLTSGWNKH